MCFQGNMSAYRQAQRLDVRRFLLLILLAIAVFVTMFPSATERSYDPVLKPSRGATSGFNKYWKDEFCFTKHGIPGKSVGLAGARERMNNWVVMLGNGIASAIYSNASILYLDVGFYNITYKLFDPEFLPSSDCWDVRYWNQSLVKVNISIGGYEMLTGLPRNAPRPLECPYAGSMILASGRMVPRKHVREKAEAYLADLRKNYTKIVAVHARYPIHAGMDHSARSLLKNPDGWHWYYTLSWWNYSIFNFALEESGVVLDDDTVVIVTAEPREARFFQEAMHRVDPEFPIHRPPYWGSWGEQPNVYSNGVPKNSTGQMITDQDWVLIDMWLLSYADVLMYMYQSSASRTIVMWNVLNNPEGKIWPSHKNFWNLTEKIQVQGCYHGV